MANNTSAFSVPSITCGGCAVAIRRSLGALEGIGDIAVDVAAKTVTVMPRGTVETDTILSALDRAGFPATKIETATAAEKAVQL